MKLDVLRKEQVLSVCKSLLKDYLDDLSEDEIEVINNIIINEIDFKKAQVLLDPILRKIWNKELSSGKYEIIAWNKRASNVHTGKGLVKWATISEVGKPISFCGLTTGSLFEIDYDSILGACLKDGATLVQDVVNEYTIAKIGDKAINSYNGASKLFTPKQLIFDRLNDYRSNHNEIILDRQKIKFIKDIDYSEVINRNR